MCNALLCYDFYKWINKFVYYVFPVVLIIDNGKCKGQQNLGVLQINNVSSFKLVGSKLYT